jgi:tRNA-2-methylthio-N6-dimethylallyladenosine synthase
MLKTRLDGVDEFLPIEEVGFDNEPVRSDKKHGLVPITNGCNNFCTFCVVPFTRGREVSRPFSDIITECKKLAANGFSSVTLIGQNVNSYGADLVHNSKLNLSAQAGIKNEKFDENKITYVKHLGRLRIPTLFPYLLSEICKINRIEKIDFISSNPWDFSDELIKTIAGNPKISRRIHLPIQSGDNTVLKKMNRWYTREEYLDLVKKIRDTISGVTISTDIIVGFCDETEAEFENTVDLCKKVGFSKAYVAMYSDRPMTAAHKVYHDNLTYKVKKRRWKILEEMINRANLKAGTYQ